MAPSSLIFIHVHLILKMNFKVKLKTFKIFQIFVFGWIFMAQLNIFKKCASDSAILTVTQLRHMFIKTLTRPCYKLITTLTQNMNLEWCTVHLPAALVASNWTLETRREKFPRWSSARVETHACPAGWSWEGQAVIVIYYMYTLYIVLYNSYISYEYIICRIIW